jgi:phosphoserine phosphatase
MAEKKPSIAAFFDLDGTLIPRPSLEQRFFRLLLYRRAISMRNYWAWLKEAFRLLPRGLNAIRHSNKMYLRGVHIPEKSDTGDGNSWPLHKSGHQRQGQAPAPFSKETSRGPRWPVPTFFPAAFQRAARHARQGHAIVLISGTLEPLALTAAKLLEAGLQLLGVVVQIRVCATRLEEVQGRWTGKIVGKAMFGEAKAHAVKQVAQEMQLDLTKCWAYGDTVQDRWMLAAVGHPVVVNPSRKLERASQLCGWPVQQWAQRRNLMEKKSSLQREGAATGDCQHETGREARRAIFADGPTKRLGAGVARSGSLG